MKEAIGGTWLFQIVIVFVLLFTGYMCLTINHSKAFAIKDEIVKTIERNNGVDLTRGKDQGNIAIGNIVEKLKSAGYRTSGDCNTLSKNTTRGLSAKQGGWVGFDRDGKIHKDGKNSTFCIRQVNIKGSVEYVSELPNTVYYQVGVFYQLDLPVLNSLMSFSVKGDTRIIYNPVTK